MHIMSQASRWKSRYPILPHDLRPRPPAFPEVCTATPASDPSLAEFVKRPGFTSKIDCAISPVMEGRMHALVRDLLRPVNMMEYCVAGVERIMKDLHKEGPSAPMRIERGVLERGWLI